MDDVCGERFIRLSERRPTPIGKESPDGTMDDADGERQSRQRVRATPDLAVNVVDVVERPTSTVIVLELPCLNSKVFCQGEGMQIMLVGKRIAKGTYKVTSE